MPWTSQIGAKNESPDYRPLAGNFLSPWVQERCRWRSYFRLTFGDVRAPLFVTPPQVAETSSPLLPITAHAHVGSAFIPLGHPATFTALHLSAPSDKHFFSRSLKANVWWLGKEDCKVKTVECSSVNIVFASCRRQLWYSVHVFIQFQTERTLTDEDILLFSFLMWFFLL